MKVLMVGGTGILSSEICALAISKGFDVTILNRGKREEFIHPRAKLLVANWRSESIKELYNKIRKNGPYDVVVDFITYNVSQLKKSIDIFHDMTKQYIFISSATAYIEKTENYKEEFEIGNKDWEYSYNKSECEWYLTLNKNNLPFKFTIIRPYVTYGITRIPYQIAPIEYYTILNRIICEKPIPICGLNTRCTLTWSKDFAVGVVGLFLNEKAYGQAIHITANESTTWRHVIDLLGTIVDKKVTLVDISKEWLLKNNKVLKIDVCEILGDKGRNMIFDNTKIKKLVPDFKGDISIDMGIKSTMEYLMTHPNNCEINYTWDAQVDFMISKYLKESGQKPLKGLTLRAYKEKLTMSIIIKYIFNRYYGLEKIYTILKKIK